MILERFNISPFRVRTISAVLAALAVSGVACPAMAAQLFVPGSTVQVDATDSPDTFNASVILANGTTLLDNGAVSLTTSIVQDGPASQWVTFAFSTTSGAALAQPSQYWSVYYVGINAAVPVNFSADYIEFTSNGVALTQTASIFGGTLGPNPVPGQTGTGIGAGGFVDPLPAGPVAALGTYITPWSYLNADGIDSSKVNGYELALQFTSLSPVPEPATWMSSLAGLLGIGLFARRRGQKSIGAHTGLVGS